jgi:DNA adenine methylase
VELQRPFLKWAGGKTKLVPAIGAVVPVTARRLVEPFVGSGAVALNLGLPENLLADTNADLIGVYARLRDAPEAFIAECAGLFTPEGNSAAVYYQRREEFNATADPARRAALFVYLNRHGYNGLCRYNARGGFNVPFGRYRAPYFPRDELHAFHALLRRSTLVHADFRAVLTQAGAGDFVYCDPPYVPASATANFTAYARTAFGPAEQQELAAGCEAARRRGAIVALSNHDTLETRALYAGADECHELLVRRQISCHGANRTKARELLVVYRPAA